MADHRDFERLHELEELFADLWQVPRFASGTRRGYRPQVDCYKTDDPPELTVVVEVAGADPEQIEVVVDGERLVVAGVRPRPRCEGQVWHRSEIDYGRFEREVALAEDVDVERASATYDHGLLRIVLPVASKSPRQAKVPIEVRARP